MQRRRRLPDPEELELWKRVTDTATPISGRVQRLSESEPPPESDMPAEPAPERKPIPPFTIGSRARSAPTSVPSSQTTPSAPVRMDPRKFAKLRKGKIEPEARIDLHGMTLTQAHPALIGFVRRARTDGQRLILVITGKGNNAPDGGTGTEPRGVLRQNVPKWLETDPLRSQVLEFASAHRQHGGSGAFYVYLKRVPTTEHSGRDRNHG